MNNEIINGWTMKQWALCFAELDLNYTSISAAMDMQRDWRNKHAADGPDEQPLVQTPDGIDHRPVNFMAAGQFFTMYIRWKVDERRKGKRKN